MIGGTRQTSASVEFRHPFQIGDDERELPAGIYRIETLEEEHASPLGSFFVAVAIDLTVCGRECVSTRVLKPQDLRDALMRDRERNAQTKTLERARRGMIGD